MMRLYIVTVSKGMSTSVSECGLLVKDTEARGEETYSTPVFGENLSS
jgi:hypothetical protein